MICWTSTSGRNGQAAVIVAGEAGGGGVVGVVLAGLLTEVDRGAGGDGGGVAGTDSPLQEMTKKSMPTKRRPQVLFILET
ncbi:hypothetical protein AORI_0207 [Amycolatopsis keratiniphila]|uniref:Uncharacterized protein n=1 Tax=Amycolatopsis keratiniphila TaxID=129921 RepID=R4SRH6_9PSEU|nr:hypothetical protein AORI_0207 [Amycolatopsis keratiniphila]